MGTLIAIDIDLTISFHSEEFVLIQLKALRLIVWYILDIAEEIHWLSDCYDPVKRLYDLLEVDGWQTNGRIGGENYH